MHNVPVKYLCHHSQLGLQTPLGKGFLIRKFYMIVLELLNDLLLFPDGEIVTAAHKDYCFENLADITN